MESKGKSSGSKGEFLTDIQELRRRARQHIEDGAVTPGYGADRETVVRILNDALATEIVCVLRYSSGGPGLDPQGMNTRSHTDYIEGESLSVTEAAAAPRRSRGPCRSSSPRSA
jgi:hypothetical protein